MKKKSIYYLFCIIFSIFIFSKIEASETNLFLEEKPMVVVIPSYNNLNWFKKNLGSIFFQDYVNIRIIYVNDCSNDGMTEELEGFLKNNNIDFRLITFDNGASDNIDEVTENFIQLVNEDRSYFTLINNKSREGGPLANLYRSIHSCEDNEIIVTIDGDDWFAHEKVLKELNEYYSRENKIWLTHGRLVEYPNGHATWCEPIPEKVIKKNAFRTFKCPSHIRTFYAWLFKKIELQDLLSQGKFYTVAADMVTMYPMIEMAGERHAFISKINYVYNVANELNENKVNTELQRDVDKEIRKKTPYKRL